MTAVLSLVQGSGDAAFTCVTGTLANAAMNLIGIVIVSYVTLVTRRLDKTMNHGGE